jgi:hypothetical protein
MVKNRIITCIIKALFCAALFFAGAGAGLGVNVFMARGVPVIHGGGELFLLLAIPASAAAGFYTGTKYIIRRRRRYDQTAEHTD